MPKELYRHPGMCMPEGEAYDLDLAKQSVGKGWHGLLEQIFASKPRDVAIVQVKEKFGGLRCYWKPINEISLYNVEVIEFVALINEAETASLKICEDCGKPGSTAGSKDWIRCLCPDCRVEWNKR